MSRRSQVIQQRKALAAPITNAMLEASHKPVQLGLAQLADMLISQGVARGYKILTSTEPKCVRLVATCGDLQVPLDFTPEDARKLSDSLTRAAEAVDPQTVEEEPPVVCSAAAEELLSEFIAAAEPPPDWTADDEAALQAAVAAHDAEYLTSTCTSCFREVVHAPGFFTEQEAVEAAELENYFREQEQAAEACA